MTETPFAQLPWPSRLRSLHRHKFVRDAFGLSAGRGLNLVLGILSTLIFGIVFSTSDIAMISLFDMLVQMLMAFGVNWSAAGVVRFGKEELQNSESLSHTSSTRLHVIFPIVVAAVLLLVTFRGSVLAYIGSNEPMLVWYLIASLLVATLNEQVTSLLGAREKHVANAMFYVAQGVAKLLILGAFISGLVQPSVLGFVAATMWTNLLIVLVRLPSCGRSFLYPVCRVSAEDLRIFLRYVVPQLWGFVGIYVVNWVDVYFIRKNCTMDELGAYQFLYTIFVKFAVFAYVANTLLFPRIMAWKKEDPSAISRFTRGVPHLVLLVVMFACGILLVIFPSLFDLFFGDKYAIAYSSFALMVCSVPCYFTSYLFIPVLNSFDRVKYVQTVNIISAVCNCVIDYILVPRHGIVGAALGTFVAYWIKAFLLMFPVHANFGVKLPLMLVLNAVIVALAATLYLSAVSV